MRSKLLVLCLTLLLPFICQGQNWQTVRSGDTSYFTAGEHLSYKGHYYYPPAQPPMVDSPILRVIYIVSATQVGTDSLFQFYTSLRDTFRYTRSKDTCIDTLAPSWLGPGFIRQPDGAERYFNSRKDTITIRTHDTLGSSWLLARDTSGNRFIGTIVQTGVMMVDGVADSFKTISIQVFNGSNPINHPYGRKVLQLSKAHGWLQTLDLFRFPNTFQGGRTGIVLDSTQHVRLPAAFRKSRIMQNISWKYRPGNEWIWKHEARFMTNPDRAPTFTTVRHDSVLSFQLISPGVGLATIRSIEFYRLHKFTTNLPPPVYQGYVDSSSTTVLTHVDTVRDISVMPVSTHVENGWRSAMKSRFYVWPYDSVRYFITRADLYYYDLQYKDGCMRLLVPISAPDDYNSFSTILPDFGVVGDYVMNVHAFSYQEEYGRYIYIKTGLDSFGTRVNVASLDVPTITPGSPFSIIPNPANDLLRISSAANDEEVGLTLRNMLGQSVIQHRFRGQELSLSTSHLPSGLYFLEIAGLNFRQTARVLIRH